MVRSAARPMARRACLSALLLIAALSSGVAQKNPQPQGPVRIGTYDNPPKIFTDSQGRASGFLAELTAAIMAHAHLSFEFVHGTWTEGLERLLSGEIDVMLDVAYSEERAALYDFNGETVLINWGMVYAREGLSIESFLELDGLTVAGMRGSIHTEGEDGLLSLAKSFDIDMKYLPVEDYEAAFRAIEEGKADAAVVNRIFGLEQEGKRRRVARTNVFFNPNAIKYAFNKKSPRTARLVGSFDEALVALKKDKGSVFYRSMERFLPGFVERRSVLPPWLKVVLPVIALCLAAALAFVYALFREIHRRRLVETELIRAKEAAETASRAKSAFLANTSHEIRTPMNAVLGYAQLLGSDPGLSAEQRGFIDKIELGGEHLLSIINDILDMSKIESGKTVLAESSYDIHATVDEALALAKPKAEEKGLVLVAEIDPSLPRYVLGDEGKLRQILVNLLGNAVKFTERGEVRLRAEASLPDGSGDSGFSKLRFAVSDTGIGIPAKDLERVFEPFEQSRGSEGVRDGTGLGLSISRALARLMGGDIRASSEPGRGSVFVFTALAKPSEKALGQAHKRSGAAGSIIAVREPTLVLIADDRDSNRDILVRMLRAYGFETIEARDGAEAVRAFAERRPRIVLLDIVMPVMGGIEALGLMRAREAEKGLPRAAILAVTASSLEEERARVIAAGADEFIRKPFRLGDLLESLSRFVAFRRAEEGAAAVAGSGAKTAKEAGRASAEETDREESRRLAVAESAALDPALRSALWRAMTIGDVGKLRELAANLAGSSPLISSLALRASESFDFDSLARILESRGVSYG